LKKIGLLSDTHGHLHPRVTDFFADCDEIWHAGDIGTYSVTEKLKEFKPLRAVHGNIDDSRLRLEFPAHLYFQIEQLQVFITHIGGYPGKYSSGIKELLIRHKPALFICGHSHILKVMYDQTFNLLYINPGAAGNSGMHQKITFVRFQVDGHRISELEIFEADRR